MRALRRICGCLTNEFGGVALYCANHAPRPEDKPPVDWERARNMALMNQATAADRQPKPPAEGVKHDSAKPRWSLFPQGVLAAVLEVLEVGARKYAVDNWKRVPEARTRYYDALMRHIEARWRGEKRDPETGKLHWAHAACCVLFLIWFDLNEDTDNGN